jgi:hypothetical protein
MNPYEYNNLLRDGNRWILQASRRPRERIVCTESEAWIETQIWEKDGECMVARPWVRQETIDRQPVWDYIQITTAWTPGVKPGWRVTGTTTPGDLDCIMARAHEEDL